MFLTKTECGESWGDSWRTVYGNKEMTGPDAGAGGRAILEYV
jgi:hypothetical protein